MRLAQRVVEAFVPAELRHDAELLRRARLLVSVAVALAPITLGLAAARWLVDGPRSIIAPLVAATAALFAMVPFVVRGFGALRAGATLFIGAALVTLTTMLLAERGIGSEALLWLPTVPVAAALLLGARDVPRWTVLALGALGLAIARDLHFGVPQLGNYLLRAVSSAGAIGFGAVLGRVYELGRARALAEVAARERRFRALIDGMPDALLRIDATGRIVDVHLPRQPLTLPLRADRLIGCDVGTALPKEIATRLRALASDAPIYEQTLDLDGDVHLQLIVVRLEEGDSLALLHDVTAVATAERDRALSAQLASSLRQRDEFISVASHELRTPLTSMKLLVDRVRRLKDAEFARLPKTVVDAHRRIAKQVGRLETLLNELLDVSRVLEGRLTIRPEQVPLDEIVGEVVARFDVEAARSGSSIALDLTHIEGYWDRSRLDQIATNLVSNALKYGGGRPIEISVRVSRGEARLIVTDHGIGIAPEDHARVFERFERADDPNRREGLGLGLWITRQLAVAMGGDIQLESEPGAGSTFTLRLPIAAVESAPLVRLSQNPRPA